MAVKHFIWIPVLVFAASIGLLLNYGKTSLELAEGSHELSHSMVQITRSDAELRRCIAGMDVLVRRIARMEQLVSAKQVHREYTQRSQCLMPLIERIVALVTVHDELVGMDGKAHAISDLRVQAESWLEGAQSILGLGSSQSVLTLDGFRDRSQRIDQTLIHIESQVQLIPNLIDQQGDRQLAALVKVLGISVLTFSLVIVAVIILMRRFTHDLDRIATAMWELCRGNLSVDFVTSQHRGEVHRLAEGVRAFRQALISVKAAEERYAGLARHDSLTNVCNRRRFMELGEAQIGQYPDSELIVFKIDLDRFKHVNDTYGHAAGDAYLVDTVQVMQACLGDADILARLGGDEFAVLVTAQSSGTLSSAIAERLVVACSAPVRVEGISIDRSISIGISNYPKDGATLDALLVSADIALYESKERGRGQYMCVNEDLIARNQARNVLSSELELAVSQGEICAFFQPKVDSTSLDIIGFEALVRWRHPQRGLLAPGQFIDIAESSDIIIGIGEHMLLEAIHSTHRLNAQGVYCSISINASARELNSPRYAERFIARLEEHQIQASDVCVELLETVALESENEQVSINLNRLSDYGVRIWIDDFGIGFSTVGVLQHHYIHGIKIDRRFVCTDASDDNSKTLLSAIVEMAHGMQKQCLLEGVEDVQQLGYAERIGCKYIQGYHIARPMPIDELLVWCEDHCGNSSSDRSRAA